MKMARVGRARERGETEGFMKVLVDAESRKILGAALLGIEGDEAVHALADVMYAGAPYTVIQRAVHIHPTVSELFPHFAGRSGSPWFGSNYVCVELRPNLSNRKNFSRRQAGNE